MKSFRIKSQKPKKDPVGTQWLASGWADVDVDEDEDEIKIENWSETDFVKKLSPYFKGG